MDPTTFATAYGLSTSIGIRPFLTLALASLAMHFGYLHPAHVFAFLGSDGASILLGGLAALEFAGDKIPVVDHLLHVVHFATKPIAAAVIVGTTITGTGSPNALDYAGMGLGAVNALGVHTGIATVRGASTAVSFGAANPFISVGEDVLAVFAAVFSILLPVIGCAFAVAVTVALLFVARKVYMGARYAGRVAVPVAATR